MKLHGREIGFLRTVKTTSELSKLCPDEDFARIEELFNGKVHIVLETGAKIIHFLNEGYEMNKYFNEPDYEPKVLTVEEIMYLPDDKYNGLLKEAFESLNKGAETTIELEESKKNKKTKTK